MSWFNKILQTLWTEVSTPSPLIKEKQAPLPCKTCNGLGNVLVNNEEVFPCPTCGGQSVLEQSGIQSGLKCAMCGGTGKQNTWSFPTDCTFCDGSGYVQLPGEKTNDTNPLQSFIFRNQKSKVCPDCEGNKWIEITNPNTPIFSINTPKKRQVCGKCRGTGKV